MRNWIFISFLLISGQIFTQNQVDTLPDSELKNIEVRAYRTAFPPVRALSSVENQTITSGKKSEVIALQYLPANVVEKNARQIFAKIPGVLVYDMDGSGNQINIATRGLDPHRSWEFNVRQNGILTNSDMYGYPASHYSVPMEAVASIQLIRGTGALQYGAQFGGMVNYLLKFPDTSRTFSAENISSVGAFGLLSTYNSVGGKVGKWTYSAFFQRRVSDGYRKNARSHSQGQYAMLSYQATKNLAFKAEVSRSEYRFQIPGPLTDAMFDENPRQATRSRNFYSPDIIIPSFSVDWQVNKKLKIDWQTNAIMGDRSSVIFVGTAITPDTIVATTNSFKPRSVDIDLFNSYTSQLRMRADYQLGRMASTLVSGVQYINNHLHRRQQGNGTTGSDYDLTVLNNKWGRDIHLYTQNWAFFAENLFHLTSRWQVSLGVRLENGVSKVKAETSYLSSDALALDLNRHFPLLGVTSQYQISENVQAYGGWSQAYRPVVLADLVPPTALDRVDKNLKDAFGHNIELGLRGNLFEKLINFDVTAFELLYNNRIGTLVQIEGSSTIFLKTNTGDSRTRGIEAYIESKIWNGKNGGVSVFTSNSIFDAKYIHGNLRRGNENVSIVGNQLEGAPKWMSRSGLQVAHRTIAAVLQYSYVSETYADALNTVEPNASGTTGIVPKYSVWDVNFIWKVSRNVTLRGGVSNLLDAQYFTKRPIIYPGPGVWSSDGRGWQFAVGYRF